MAPRPRPARRTPVEVPDTPNPGACDALPVLFPDPSATSHVASVAPVRRPLPPDVAPDTRIRRLHLRKGAWWAWAPRHDPSDDHLYGWLRLDDEIQQQLTSRLARLEVPQIIAEKEIPSGATAPPIFSSTTSMRQLHKCTPTGCGCGRAEARGICACCIPSEGCV